MENARAIVYTPSSFSVFLSLPFQYLRPVFAEMMLNIRFVRAIEKSKRVNLAKKAPTHLL